MQVTIGNSVDYIYITTKEVLIKAVDFIKESLKKTDKVIGVDTETYPLFNIYGSAANWRDPYTSTIRCIQIGLLNNPVPFIFDVLKIGKENCKYLIDFLMDETIRKVFHNSIFDRKQFKGTFDIWLPNCWCTLVMAKRVNVCTGFRAGQMRGNSLKALARDYFAIDLSKTEQTSDWSNPNLTSEQLEYAALDVIKGKEHTQLKHSVLLDLYYLFLEVLYTPAPKGFGGYCKLKDYKEPIEVDQAANAILAEIEYTGMPVSVKMLDLIYNTASRELEDLKLYLCKSFGLPLQQTIEYTKEGPQLKIILSEKTEKTLNSPQQLVQLVNKVLRSQGIVLDNVKAESMEAVLKRLKIADVEEETEEDEYDEDYYENEEEEHDAKFGIELIDKLVKYKELVKLTGTDYRKLINPVTGRVHSSYQCIGASTGRMSSGGKGSFNCQQVSKTSLVIKYLLSQDIYNTRSIPDLDAEVNQSVNMRYAFVTDLIDMLQSSCDFDSQEAKNVAAICGDPELMKAYLLLLAYATGEKELPKHPETGEPYIDPNTDIHILAAASINPEVKWLVENEPWNANKDNPLVAIWRQLGKILNYALIYLAQAGTIAQQTGRTVEESQEAIDKYFTGFKILKEWLDSTATIAVELRWIRTITGDLVFINESNSHGIGDKNTAARKAVNHAIQSLGATQSKLALIKAHKAFKELNIKYKDILNGRAGALISIIHDEINALIPGQCNFDLVEDKNSNKKYNSNKFVKPKTTIDKNNSEHLLGEEYGNALKKAMEDAMQETFDIINSPIPAGATVENSYYWKH